MSNNIAFLKKKRASVDSLAEAQTPPETDAWPETPRPEKSPVAPQIRVSSSLESSWA